MKKTLFTFILLISAAGIHAQVATTAVVRTGLNLASITNMNADTKADFYIGGGVSIQFTDFYALQPELNYTRQGAKIRYNEIFTPAPAAASDDLEIQYLSIGVINKFRIAQGFHALVGPSVDIKLSDNINGEMAGADITLAGGLGYQFANGFGVEARFKQGLVDIYGSNFNDGYNEDYNDDVSFIRLNNVIQLGITYTFKK